MKIKECILKKKLIILSILMSIKVFAKEDGGSIEQNYDYGCIEENIKNKCRLFKSVLCLDEKLNKIQNYI